jgi:5'-3' exonuclease
MDIYLVDGTYELFRHFFVVPKSADSKGQEIGATRAVLGSVLNMMERGTRYVGVATDHVIESFRNDLYLHYKTGAGIEEALFSQFPILEEALQSMGVKVWPMVEFEADDALAAAAVKASDLPEVQKVIICTPDKDLSQCVIGDRIVQLDRMRNTIRNEAGVIEKFGVSPKSIPDYLALVGDTADGYPGLPGWGAKASGTVLGLYGHLENIPKIADQWSSSIRGAKKLAATLQERWDDAILFRKLATLRYDVPVFNSLDELRWRGPSPSFEETCERLKAKELLKRCNVLTEQLAAGV